MEIIISENWTLMVLYTELGASQFTSRKKGKPLIIYFMTIKTAQWVKVLVAIISFTHKFYLLERTHSHRWFYNPTSHVCRTYTCMHTCVTKITKMNMLSTFVTRDFYLWSSFIFCCHASGKEEVFSWVLPDIKLLSITRAQLLHCFSSLKNDVYHYDAPLMQTRWSASSYLLAPDSQGR